MPLVLLGLGSNIGDRLAHLQAATRLLGDRMRLHRTAGVYETAPMYVADQAPFLNSAVQAETDLSPRELLANLKEVEAEIGRKGGQRYGPREIDVDLIAYGTLRYRYTAEGAVRLEVPHPKIVERRFVLAPLADIAPDMLLPGLGIVQDLLARTDDEASSVIKLDHALLPVLGDR